jgi:hypothetical protein
MFGGLTLWGVGAASPDSGVERTSDKRSEPKLTYSRDIAPILYRNCLPCHRKGEVAPFALENYKDAGPKAALLKAVTAGRSMPPWKADSHGEFLNERRLTDDQIGKIAQWADSGAAEGDPSDLPKKPVFPDGWNLGQPDLIVELPETYNVPAEGKDEYRCFVIPTNFDDDRYVAGLEFQPGNRKVVHHIIAYLDQKGNARKLDAADSGPGYENPSAGSGPGFFPAGFMGGWAPGNDARMLPDGIGNLLPRGADIVLEVHYNKSGKPEKDRSKLGIHFSKKPVDKRVRIMPIINPFLNIPPGEARHEVQAKQTIRRDVTVLAVTPHMHMLGKSMRVAAKLPNSTEKQLVKIADWDFNWQLNYAFKEPMKLPYGTELSLLATYDNSSGNPRNPYSPPRAVTWGESTKDEMCIAFVAYIADEENLTRGISIKDPYDFVQPAGKSDAGK